MTVTLFIGDLSSLCSVRDIENAFSPCGKIVDIRLKTDELTKKRLSYGFVEFSNENEADMAVKTLNGYELRGRALRVSLAKPKSPTVNCSDNISINPPPKLSGNANSSIHVTFVTVALPGLRVSEESLRELFSFFGNFVDVIVKKSNAQNVLYSKGYAFVHFADTLAGKSSAVEAVCVLRSVMLNNVHYECSLSKIFEDNLHINNKLTLMHPVMPQDVPPYYYRGSPSSVSEPYGFAGTTLPLAYGGHPGNGRSGGDEMMMAMPGAASPAVSVMSSSPHHPVNHHHHVGHSPPSSMYMTQHTPPPHQQGYYPASPMHVPYYDQMVPQPNAYMYDGGYDKRYGLNGGVQQPGGYHAPVPVAAGGSPLIVPMVAPRPVLFGNRHYNATRR